MVLSHLNRNYQDEVRVNTSSNLRICDDDVNSGSVLAGAIEASERIKARDLNSRLVKQIRTEEDQESYIKVDLGEDSTIDRKEKEFEMQEPADDINNRSSPILGGAETPILKNKQPFTPAAQYKIVKGKLKEDKVARNMRASFSNSMSRE